MEEHGKPVVIRQDRRLVGTNCCDRCYHRVMLCSVLHPIEICFLSTIGAVLSLADRYH